MPGSPLGQSVVRLEDPELLRGGATYVDDLPVDGVLHAVFVRSPYAHARIGSIDTAEAAAMPGVVAAYTASDLGLAPHHVFVAVGEAYARPPLATGKVRFAGEQVALVVAATRAQAVDAAEAVAVQYEPLPAVVGAEAALAPGAPVLFEAVGSNACVALGDPDEPNPLDGAEVVVRGRFESPRMAAAPMEANAIAVVPDGDRLVVHAATQTPHVLAAALAEELGRDPAGIRVVAPHVGGGFGAKIALHTEFSAVAAAAVRLGRPVKWVESRSEDLVALPQGRAQTQYVEMGFTRAGRITGMRARVVADAGAYPTLGAVLLHGATRTLAQGTYRIPATQFDGIAVTTNTTPTGALRGAGRPEATAMLERVMDLAADELGIDPAELRRMNFLEPDEFPLTTLTGAAYDTGDYATALDAALAAAGYPSLRAEQARRRAGGDRVQLGIGVASYVEITAGGMTGDFGAVEVHADGRATMRLGTSAHGQGHATTFAQVVSDRLGIPVERIDLVQSDTDLVPMGIGTFGSRSLQLGGTAVYRAAEAVLAKAKGLAAHLLEADPADIELADGRLGVAGVPSRALTWGELAAAATDPGLPEALAGGLGAGGFVDQGGATFPFGSHVAVVEVDTETGHVTPVRHVAVDDCGRLVNPLVVAGQQHGGIAHGVAQALYEEVVWDADGNPRTATFADYLVPSAAELCSFEVSNTITPTHLNPLGAKGIGEAGSIGSTPAVQNAVVDALAHLGVRHVDLPCSPERVWRAIDAARAGRGGDVWREPPAQFASIPRGAGPAGQVGA